MSDAKLARITKTYFLVQLSAYAGAARPAAGPPARAAGGAAGQRRARRATAPTTSPPTCGRFAATPSRRSARAWRTPTRCPAATAASAATAAPASSAGVDDDHLSLVAGLRRDQVARLEAAGVATLTALAELPERHQGAARPARHAAQAAPPGRAAAARAHAPASRSTSCCPTRTATASACCPQPAPGDLFFDIEGDPYIGDKGLEYLFGVGWLDDDGSEAVPAVLGARPRRRSGAAFEQLIDFFMGWLAEHPGSHIYHYASYEEQALKTLVDVARHPRGGGRPAAAHRAPWSTCSGWCARAFASPSTATR